MRRYPPVFRPYENGQFEASRGTSSSNAIEALLEFSIRESNYRNARDYWQACMGLVQAGCYRLYWPPDSHPGHTTNEIISVKISGRTPAGARTRVAIDTVMEKLRYYVLGEDALGTLRRIGRGIRRLRGIMSRRGGRITVLRMLIRDRLGGKEGLIDRGDLGDRVGILSGDWFFMRVEYFF
ncbi:hypothetical protein N8T08_008492 [Aspergillus melleus]|uniref:Uncharacterized protein n=1 Tax=Aspergillus melleus TaxID=138277 RepID=A0ACC3AVM8_9EURO|nr:hypothetical protein N8T08_008492 [Aspergillus melleus]